METVTLALAQLRAGPDPYVNQSRALEFCREAAGKGAQLILFPELFSHGYARSDTSLSRLTPVSGDYFEPFRTLALQLHLAIAITALEEAPAGACNALRVYDTGGQLVLHYAKVHTCAFAMERDLMAGDRFEVTDLSVGDITLRVGALICYDREFPEAARLLALKGAELILVPNACPLGVNRLAQINTRAMENYCALAVANYPRGVADADGHSCLVDGIAYDERGREREMFSVQGGKGEELLLGTLDLAALRRYRKEEHMYFAMRHPELYAPLAFKARGRRLERA